MLLYVIICCYMLLYVIGLDNILRFQSGTLLVDLLNDMCKDGHGMARHATAMAQSFGGIFDPCKDHGARGRLRQARHAMGRCALRHGSAMAAPWRPGRWRSWTLRQMQQLWTSPKRPVPSSSIQFHADLLTFGWLAWLNPMPPLGVLSSDLQAKADAEYNMQQAGNRCPNILGKWSLTLGRRMVKHGF